MVPVDLPIQGPLPFSGQHLAESELLEVPQPAAPVEVAQPAREAPRAETSALTIDPPSQPLSSEPHVAESEPLEARRPTVPAQIAQEEPSGEASALTSNPPSSTSVV